MQPLIIINAKTYPESTGKNALHLATICEDVAKKGARIGLALQSFDLRVPMHHAFSLAQHVDCGEPGRHTGYFLATQAKKLGVEGTLLNHSEHKIPFDVLEKTILECKKLGLMVIACADTPEEVAQIVSLKPDYIALEPPELIAGTISISTARPEIITEAMAVVGDIPLLVGAGIKTRKDIDIAMKLGAAGVLLASGVVKAQNPRAVLESLAGL